MGEGSRRSGPARSSRQELGGTPRSRPASPPRTAPESPPPTLTPPPRSLLPVRARQAPSRPIPSPVPIPLKPCRLAGRRTGRQQRGRCGCQRPRAGSRRLAKVEHRLLEAQRDAPAVLLLQLHADRAAAEVPGSDEG